MNTRAYRGWWSRWRAARTGAAGADRGSAAVEAVVVVPVLLAFGLLFVAAARLAMAGQAVDAASEHAARAASLARTVGTAQSEAQRAAAQSLTAEGQPCTATTVQADTQGLAAAVGEAATVTVTVSCTVPLGDLFFFGGGPGVRTLNSKFTSVVDAYRQREGQK
ncbi:TadE/TadG family type IV pilus assembly protein [Streptomyces sp. NPDC048442]|uniref:TadE/TadG family type IV pilus assembly protein n=1 Tax=Streptomyces sp. NPDC048442 TaxID=3154823 RepID=UPI003431F313